MNYQIATRQWLLVLAAASLTLALQKWVGDVTLYNPALRQSQLVLHQAILSNRLPPEYESWSELGANGTNVRIGAVYVAEALQRLTHLELFQVYRAIDTSSLFLSLILLFSYLQRTNGSAYALTGVLYFTAILPLTYLFAYFHPWDRISLLCWIVLLMLLRAGRLVAFGLLLVASTTIKYDIVVLPALHFIASVSRKTFKRVLSQSLALCACVLGTLTLLKTAFPGGFEQRDIIGHIIRNTESFLANATAYPPVLVFLTPVILGAIGYSRADRLSRASMIVGLFLFLPAFLGTNFIEVRAQMPVLVLMLPCALTGLELLVGASHAAANARSRSGEQIKR